MEITARHRGDILVLDMTGRLDTSTSGRAHDAIVDFANAKPKRVVLNLDKLEYVSSAGLRVILTLAKLLQTSNGEMKICRANGSVNEVLQTSGFNSLIKIVDDEEAAIASWR
jgi:anti-anti-sigma factor